MVLPNFPYIALKTVNGINFKMEVGSLMEQMVVDGVFFEKEVLEEMLDNIKTGDVIFDVGSSTGTHTIPCGIKTGESGVVYSFEPDTECAAVLRYNLSLNHLKNVRVLETALWDKDSSVVIHTGGRKGPAPQVTERHQQARAEIEHLPQHHEIPSRSIESLVRSGDIKPPDVLKIDVEGAGLYVLKGLGNVKPKDIFIEVHPPKGESRDEIFGLLSSNGYKLISEASRVEEIHLHFKL